VGRAEALRRSMLAMMESGDPKEVHPAHWAPFIVVGEGSVPESSTSQVVGPPMPMTVDVSRPAKKAPKSRPNKQAPWTVEIWRNQPN